jgi:parallel beta-helix repeat protein
MKPFARPLAALVLAAAALLPGPSAAQCRTATAAGAQSYTPAAGLPVSGTSLSSLVALDGTAFQVSNVGGVLTTPTVRLMASTMIENGYNGTNGPAYYGVTFVNPTNVSITVTQVNFTATLSLFQAPTAQTPATGWSLVSATNVRWTGSVAVAAYSAAEFIFSSNTVYTAAAQTPVLTATVTAGGSPYATAAFSIQEPGSNTPYGANAVVGFDTVGAATWAPQMSIVPGASANTVVNLSIRVRESGNNGSTNNSIGANLNMTVTVPAGWSNVSVPTIAAPWTAGSVVIVQPTATSAGSVSVTTNAVITRGTSTAAKSLIVRATTPAGSYTTSEFPFTFNLNGTAADGAGPVKGKNESVVQVTGSGATTINAQFLSPALASPVRQIDFRTDVAVTGGTGSDSLNVDVYNNTSASWTTIATITPTSSFQAVTHTFTSDFAPYVNGGTMSVRFVETGAPTRILAIDDLVWTVTTGYSVNNLTGSDLNTGNIASPFKSIAKAVSVVGAQGAVYVDVGSSQSGTPYSANTTVPALVAGVAGCRTLVQGVASGGLLPLVVGTNPVSDGGFTVLGNHAQVDGFQIQNVEVGLGADVGVSDAVLSDNWVTVSPSGYGIILNANTNSQVVGNRIDGSSSGWVGVWDFGGTGDLVDGNHVAAAFPDGILVDGATGVTVQRNIVQGGYVGLHVANSTAPITLYNNTSDANTYLALYVEGATGTVTSRNNVLTNTPFGWGWDGKGTVSSDYEDLWGNGNNYGYHGTVTPGANSISANPNFVQTSNPGLATYYALPAGSPCRDTGTNVGLPYLGAGPDRGGTEQ